MKSTPHPLTLLKDTFLKHDCLEKGELLPIFATDCVTKEVVFIMLKGRYLHTRHTRLLKCFTLRNEVGFASSGVIY